MFGSAHPSSFLLVCLVVLQTGVGSTQSRWKVRFDASAQKIPQYLVFPNYMYKSSDVMVQVMCSHKGSGDAGVVADWALEQVTCMDDMRADMGRVDSLWWEDADMQDSRQAQPLKDNNGVNHSDESVIRTRRENQESLNKVKFQKSSTTLYLCQQNNMVLFMDESGSPYNVAYVPEDFQVGTDQHVSVTSVNRTEVLKEDKTQGGRVVQPWETGMYHFYFRLLPTNNNNISAWVTVGMHGKYGYISAMDWPLLPANGMMAFLYLGTATAWVLIWARTHKHSSKIHVVIGTVATAGALSHTLQFVEDATINSSGDSVFGMVWFAAVLLILQVSLLSSILLVSSSGYGLTRPVMARGVLILIVTLCTAQFISSLGYEICISKSLQLQYQVPLVMKLFLWMQTAIKVIIAGWVLVAAVSTFVHLFRRKHSSKLRVFTAFTGACVLALIAHLAIFGLGISWIRQCRTDWQNEWLFSSFGSMVSYMLLVVLMGLWRPADVHQSYAFTPLASMDDDEDELGLDSSDEDDDNPTETEKIKLEPL